MNELATFTLIHMYVKCIYTSVLIFLSTFVSMGGSQLIPRSTHSLELFRVRVNVRFRIKARIRIMIGVRARTKLAWGRVDCRPYPYMLLLHLYRDMCVPARIAVR